MLNLNCTSGETSNTKAAANFILAIRSLSMALSYMLQREHGVQM